MEWLFRMAEKFFKEHAFIRRWRKVLAVMMALVVFTTTYSLVLPAITLETGEGAEIGLFADTSADESAPDGSTVTDSIPEAGAEGTDMTTETASLAEAAPEEAAPAESAAVETAQAENAPTEAAQAATETPAPKAEETSAAPEEPKYLENESLVFENNSIKITLTVPAAAKVAKDAALSVREIGQPFENDGLDENGRRDEYLAYLAAAETALNLTAEEITYIEKVIANAPAAEAPWARFFAISVKSADGMITPACALPVEITYKNTAETAADGLKVMCLLPTGAMTMVGSETKVAMAAQTPIALLSAAGSNFDITSKFTDAGTLTFGTFAVQISEIDAAIETEKEEAAKAAAEAAKAESQSAAESAAESVTPAAESSAEESAPAEDASVSEAVESGESLPEDASEAESAEESVPAAEDESAAESVAEETEKADAEEKSEETVRIVDKASKTLVTKGSDYTVTMTYTADAKIPAGAVLSAKEILPTAYNYRGYMNKAVDALGLSEDEAAYARARFFDIKIMLGATEVTPAAAVRVDIEYMAPQELASAENMKAVHFGSEGPEEVAIADVSTDAATAEVNGVAFDAGSFSVYGVVYTVDFTYGGFTYSISGNHEISVGELFAALGIDASSDDVEDVVVNLIAQNDETVEAKELYARKQLFGSWVIKSDIAFTNVYEVTIALNNGVKYVVTVTDDAASGSFNLTDLATVRTSTNKSVTTTPQERDAAFDIKGAMLFTDAGLQQMKNYINENGESPDVAYDFSSVLNSTPLADQVAGGSGTLMSNGVVAGTYTIDPSGVIHFDFDPTWIIGSSQANANFSFSVKTDKTQLKDEDSADYKFPGVSEPIHVNYKSSSSTTKKAYTAVDNGDGSYTLNYTASFTNTENMTSLVFSDAMQGLQRLSGSTITVNGNSYQVTPTEQDDYGIKSFTVDLGSNGTAPAGTYDVSYSTKITSAQYDALKEGQVSSETNNSNWKVNGTKDVPGGSTSYKIEKPVTPVSVDKSSNADNGTAQPEDTISYSITFGDTNTKLAGLTISDYMTDLQIYQGDMQMSVNGQSAALPFTPAADDGHYSTNSTQLFYYTFPDNDTRTGPVVITYTTKIISQEQAKANDIFEAVSVSNVAEEHRSNHKDTTTTTVTYDKEVIHHVSKGVTASATDEDGNWLPGTTLTYVITIGDGTTDLSGVHVTDSMTDLQVLDASSVEISVGDDQHFESLTSGVVYSDDNQYSTNKVNVIDYVLPDSVGKGPVYIRYTTTVIDEDTANANGVYDVKSIANDAKGGKQGAGTEGHADFGEEPKDPLEKDVFKSDNLTVSIDGQEVELEDVVTYVITVGDDTVEDMSGAQVRDDMTDLQKLVGDVTVTLAEPLAADITLQDGKVVPAGSTSFAMPVASGPWAMDGVAWNYSEINDGRYGTGNARVFYYEFPSGVGKGPITITYNTQIISEDEANESGVTGTQDAFNTVVYGNNSQATVIKPKFPEEVEHKPTVSKSFAGWGDDNKTVYWDIVVEKEADSAYPLKDVTVLEDTNAGIPIYFMNTSGYFEQYQLVAEDFDMGGIVVTTESGEILEGGVDYTVDKGSGKGNGPKVIFPVLNEKVTIRISYSTDNLITSGFKASDKYQEGVVEQFMNRVKVGDHEAIARITKDSQEIELIKNGAYEEYYDESTEQTKRVMLWTVQINPDKKVISQENNTILFEDIIPDGLKVINYNSYKNSHSINEERPSIWKEWSQSSEDSLPNSAVEQIITDYVVGQKIGPVDVKQHINPYNNQSADFNLSGRSYTIYYYTYIDDEEWARITSTVTGSKDYKNSVKVNFGGDEPIGGETTVTVTAKDFLKKYDDTVENENGVVVNETDNPTKMISYRVEVNPKAQTLNSGETLTLTDRIETNMEFDPTTLKVQYYTTPGDESTLEDLSTIEGYESIVISYSDDSRYLTISGLPDATAYKVTYQNRVRSQGIDTFTNTATLIGGGSHSDRVSEEHKIEISDADADNMVISFTLRKIDENNITHVLPGVVFDLYEVDMPTDATQMTDEQFDQLLADTEAAYNGDASKIAEIKEGYTFSLSEDSTYIGTFTTTGDGTVLVKPTDPAMVEKKLYYWVETYNPYTNYKADHDPHYFVLYLEYGNMWNEEEGDYEVQIYDQETLTRHQKNAWAVDDAATIANGITVASMASDVSWSVTNVDTAYTSISARKVWVGDSDNFYGTRPEEGISLKLYRYEEGADPSTAELVDQGRIRASVYTETYTENGQEKTRTAESWPNYNWNKLPAKNTATGNKYLYYVVEDDVPYYEISYSVGTEGTEEGTVTITNTYIPPTINLNVEKSFEVAEGAAMPDQVIMRLLRYTKSKDGIISGPLDLEKTIALTASSEWAGTFKGLPTRDSKGNEYSYIVQEDMDELPVEFPYTVTYEDNGTETYGVVSGPIKVINNAPGSLQIKKSVQVNNADIDVGDTAMDGTYRFRIYDADDVEVTEGFEVYNAEGEVISTTSPIEITVEQGVSQTVRVGKLPVGTYTIREDTPDNGSYLVGSDVQVTVSGGKDDPAEIETAELTNNMDKDRVKVSKEWVNRNRDEFGNVINGTNNEWPTGVTVDVTLRKTNDGGATLEPVEKPAYYVDTTWTDTAVLSAARKVYLWDNLDPLENGYVYTVEETAVHGVEDGTYTAYVQDIDSAGYVKVINAETTNLEFTKKWENTYWKEESENGENNRHNLRIYVKLHRYYYDEDGNEVETEYLPEEAAKFETALEMYGRSGVDTYSQWGENTVTETSKEGDSKWTLYWSELPTVGTVGGKLVTYHYRVTEENVVVVDEGNAETSITDQYTTVTAEDGLTITNRYNTDTSIEAEKIWGDTSDHSDEQVTLELYRSIVGPDGSGLPFTGTVSVDQNWKTAMGATMPEPDGPIIVNVNGSDGTQHTLTLNHTNNWSTEFDGKKGVSYTLSEPQLSPDGGIASATLSSYTIDYDNQSAVVTAVCENPSYTVAVNLTGWGSSEPYNSITTKTGAVLIKVPLFAHQTSDVDKLSDAFSSDDTNVTFEMAGTEAIEGGYGAIYANVIASGISSDCNINIDRAEVYPATGNFAMVLSEYTASRRMLSALRRSPSLNATPVTAIDPNTVEVPQLPASEYLELVTQAMVTKGTLQNPVQLNSAADGTEGLWNYSWANLPADDGQGNKYYYYVKETAYTTSHSDHKLISVAYEYIYSDVMPNEIAKVVVTNTIYEPKGSLAVTKAVTGVTTSKTFKFAVKHSSGKYVQEDGSLAEGKHYFSVKDGATTTISNLILGTYTVEEDETAAAISPYELTVTAEGDGIIGEDGQVAVITLKNDYAEPTTEFEFTKLWKDTNNAIIAWPKKNSADVKIKVVLKRKLTGVEDAAYSYEYTLTSSGIEAEDDAPAMEMISEAGSTSYKFKITELPKLKDNVEYTYYLTETDAGGYRISYNDETGGTYIETEGTINNTDSSVALPDTGGPGTLIFTMLGMMLIAFAGTAYMILQRRRFASLKGGDNLR